MRYMRFTTFCDREDIRQSLTLAPRSGFLPWVRMGQIYVRDLLRLLKLAQGGRELDEEIAVVRLERATGERRSRKAGKHEAL
jgi:hypothetical protein